MTRRTDPGARRPRCGAVKPIRSAKTILTTLPPSARSRGRAAGDTCDAPAAMCCADTAPPHSLQNFAEGGSSAPHDETRAAKRAPHSRQNFEAAGFGWPQLGQVIVRVAI